MSAIVGVFNTGGHPIDQAIVLRMLAATPSLGQTTSLVAPGPGALLAVTRHEWEQDDGFNGEAHVEADDDFIIASDASIYYREDLARRLAAAGFHVDRGTPSRLILTSYAAWGDHCPEQLEGDFAFIIYDRRRRVVFCARDFAGKRPLFYAELGDTLVVASSVSAILAHPKCPRDLNLAVVGSTAAYMRWSLGTETSYAAIQVVPMAGSLSWSGAKRLWKHWTPPTDGASATLSFERAAVELREILARAVAARMAPRGPTAVWMSGGRDSTAIFGAGQHAMRSHGGTQELIPVSISYPRGDQGREDEMIAAVAQQWGTAIHWLDIADIPLFDRDERRAAERDEPAATPYENWNRALAEGARACGARVALDGNGGDWLFAGSDIYLSDLLRNGRWIALGRELRSKRRRGWHHLFESTVQPLLPRSFLALAARVRGKPELRHYLDRPVPRWLKRSFVERFDLLERERAHLPPVRGRNRSAAELRWAVSIPMIGYLHGLLQRHFLETGVLVRSPLFDRRVVEFALNRPRWERVSGVESKYLLREAMRGLLPDAVLAPRPRRTGMTLSYSRRSMGKAFPGLFRDLFRSPLLLADLGIVDPVALEKSVESYLRHGGDDLRMDLYHTLQTELWLRARH